MVQALLVVEIRCRYAFFRLSVRLSIAKLRSAVPDSGPNLTDRQARATIPVFDATTRSGYTEANDGVQRLLLFSDTLSSSSPTVANFPEPSYGATAQLCTKLDLDQSFHHGPLQIDPK